LQKLLLETAFVFPRGRILLQSTGSRVLLVFFNPEHNQIFYLVTKIPLIDSINNSQISTTNY